MIQHFCHRPILEHQARRLPSLWSTWRCSTG